MFLILFRQTGGELNIKSDNGEYLLASQASSFIFSNVFFLNADDAIQYAEDAITYFSKEQIQGGTLAKSYYSLNRDYYPLMNFVDHFSKNSLFLTYELIVSSAHWDEILQTQYNVKDVNLISGFECGSYYRYDSDNRLYFPLLDFVNSIVIKQPPDAYKHSRDAICIKHRHCFDFVNTVDINLQNINLIKMQHSFHKKSFHLFNRTHLLQYILEQN